MVFGRVVVVDDDETVDPSRPPSRNVIIDSSAEDADDDDSVFFSEDVELLFARKRRARETISPYSADVADDRDSGTRAQGQDDINDTRCLSHQISPQELPPLCVCHGGVDVPPIMRRWRERTIRWNSRREANVRSRNSGDY
jgi:hypothetical protein